MCELRRWILGLVIASGVLLCVLLFAGGLWSVLAHLGDETGARFVQGAATVIAAGFLLTHILLVTLLARAILQANMEREQNPSSNEVLCSSPPVPNQD